jgi:hypothetical protein
LSFLNAATEKPGQNTIGPRSPNTPKNAVVWAGLITIARPFFWPRRIGKMELMVGVVVGFLLGYGS